MKSAEAYKRDKKIYLYPMSKTTTGIWIGTSPQVIIDETEPPSIKGKYVREALRHSREGYLIHGLGKLPPDFLEGSRRSIVEHIRQDRPVVCH